MKKECFKCHAVKPLSEFYKHRSAKDGHQGKCKECTKADSIANRWKNIDRYREYDRSRGNRQGIEYTREYRKRNKLKYAAHNAVNNAIRDGRLERQNCEVCGTNEHIEAHHDDYGMPLSVRWLCSAHHKQWHRDNSEVRYESNR